MSPRVGSAASTIALIPGVRPFNEIEFRKKIARYLSSDGPEFKLQLVFGKSTLKRELWTIYRWHKLQEVSVMPFCKWSNRADWATPGRCGWR